MESGLITLIGATTENPSFEVIPPLISRCRVIVLEALGAEDSRQILKNALKDGEKGLGRAGFGIAEAHRMTRLFVCQIQNGRL